MISFLVFRKSCRNFFGLFCLFGDIQYFSSHFSISPARMLNTIQSRISLTFLIFCQMLMNEILWISNSIPLPWWIQQSNYRVTLHCSFCLLWKDKIMLRSISRGTDPSMALGIHHNNGWKGNSQFQHNMLVLIFLSILELLKKC